MNIQRATLIGAIVFAAVLPADAQDLGSLKEMGLSDAASPNRKPSPFYPLALRRWTATMTES